MKNIEEITASLTQDEKTVLKDTLIHGEWGDCDYDFLYGSGNIEETVQAIGFCTNDAKDGCHFSGKQVSALFRSIYKKMCPAFKNTLGQYLSHAHDWWGDGSGDMLFIREDMYEKWMEWAKNNN